jgi:hypothetical protein
LKAAGVFAKAGNELRRALASRNLSAVEHDRTSGRLIEIEAEFWNSDAAAAVLEEGVRVRTVRLDEHKLPVLISASDLASFVQQTRRRGRPQEYPWDALKDYALAVLQENGAPTTDDPEFRTQSDLEKKVAAKCFDMVGREPAESVLRTHVSKWLEEYQVAAAGLST